MSRYLPKINEYACVAHGDCAVTAPGVFTVDVTAEVVGDGPPELMLEAARACPAAAITVVDAETGEQVYP